MRLLPLVALSACTLLIAGCHSHYIETTITNRTATPILLLEVDYPSASFGTENLAPGASFQYRFKVLGSGSTKLLYTDAAHHDHTANGPALSEGTEGTLLIDIQPDQARWTLNPAAPS